MQGTLWAGEVLQEGDHPGGEKCPLVSREELQGKGPEVGTSWFVLDPERRVLKLNCSSRSGVKSEGREAAEAKPNQTKQGTRSWRSSEQGCNVVTLLVF